MATKHPEIFNALAAPFGGDVKVRKQAGRDLQYITARSAMNRLDDVLGPENWWDEYVPSENSVLCRLTIRLPDGTTLTKCDAGGYAGMADSGDDSKSGHCLPLDAQALTRGGWKYYHELRLGEQMLGYDAEAGLCRWAALTHVTVFEEPCQVVEMASKSFRMICTPNHRWVSKRRERGIVVKETSELDTRDAILMAAPCVGGDHPLTAREAAILGWLATDGSVTRGARTSEGRDDYQFHALIFQSKEPHRSEIRQLLGDDATESLTPPGERTFPGSAVASMTLERSTFRLKNSFARNLLAKAGIRDWHDLVPLVSTLSTEARGAMFEAMLDGDGQHSCSGQVVFGKKRKPGVMEAFEILATLQGVALGTPRLSTTGEVPLRTLRRQPHVWAKAVSFLPSPSQPVWCPTTTLGTWVTRWRGTITITGNSDAFKRACVKFGVARLLYNDGVPHYEETPEPAKAPPPKAALAPRKPDARTYWQMVLDATSKRNELRGESISPGDVHWMLVVIASNEGHGPVEFPEYVDAPLAAMNAHHAADPTWVIGHLMRFVSGKVTPFRVDNLFRFEREDFPLDPAKVIWEEFLVAETTGCGRGFAGEAAVFVMERTKLVDTDSNWKDTMARRKRLDALRDYVASHPCSLLPEGALP